MTNFLMLRGAVPEDRSPVEIMHDSLENEDDMWIHLFNELLGEEGSGQVWYFDRKDYKPDYMKWYTDNLQIMFESNPEERARKCKILFGHLYDVVFARGGFPYYTPILEQFPNAYKIYYGAGRRYVPKDDIHYSLILCDSPEQKETILRLKPGANVQLFIKPAVDNIFYPREAEKELDVCYVCGFPETKRKNMKWVWETCPPDLKVLQLGNVPRETPPPNFTIKKVLRSEMPFEYAKCKVGIVPYTEDDSNPRVISEMLACGLLIVCLDTVNFWREKYIYIDSDKDWFWAHAKNQLRQYDSIHSKKTANYYKENLSLPVAGKYLKGLINV